MIWDVPTTTAQETAVRPTAKEIKKEREAQKLLQVLSEVVFIVNIQPAIEILICRSVTPPLWPRLKYLRIRIRKIFIAK